MFLDALFSIARGGDFVRPKVILLAEFLKLSAKYHLLYKLLKRDVSNERLFGLEVATGDYEIFLRLFIDIFIKNQYYFVANSRKPNIVDAGAHIGLALLYFKLLYPKANVICFEPDPDNFSILKRNVTQNSIEGVTLHNAALSSVEERVRFIKAKGCKKWGSKIFHAKSDIKFVGDTEIQIETKKLSGFLPETVDLLKIDVEGSENAILQELNTSSKIKSITLIILEYHWHYRNRRGNKLSEIFAVLENNNFSYYTTYFFRNSWRIYTPFSTLKYLARTSNFLIYARRINERGFSASNATSAAESPLYATN